MNENEIMENGTEVAKMATETVVETVSKLKLSKNLKTATGVGIAACVCIVAYDHVAKPIWKWCKKKFGKKEETVVDADEVDDADVPDDSDETGENSEE